MLIIETGFVIDKLSFFSWRSTDGLAIKSFQ